MAAFRSFKPALASLFLLAGSAAFAQGNNPALQCVANAGVPPLLRAEGLTELTGDIVLNCQGGTPTAAGQTIPQANIQVFLNTNVTSRLLTGSITEAMLMIDEPAPAAQSLCTSVNGCTIAATGTGTGDYTGAVGRPNVFQSQLSGNQSVLFLGVPIDPPGSTGTRVIRITNIRANASAVAPGGSGTPGQVLALISASPQNILPINNPQQIVGYVQKGLTFSLYKVNNSGTQGNLTFAQCSSNNFSSNALASSEVLRFTEGFATAFKTRTSIQDPAGATSPAPIPQNIPGQIFATTVAPGSGPATTGITAATESGFYNPSLASPYGTAGLADFGTRLQAVFNNIPNGVTIYVSTTSVATSSPTAFGVLINSDNTPFNPALAGNLGSNNITYNAPAAGTGLYGAIKSGVQNIGVVALTAVNGSATATWEVTAESALAIENLDFAVAYQYAANVTNNLPQTGVQSTVNGRFAPSAPAYPNTAQTSASPVPRFVDTSSAVNTFIINICQTTLLFPFVTNAPGFDTGLAISNTSKDPFGTATQTGSCTLNFYGDNQPSAPVSIAGTSSAGVANSIAAGSYAAVPLSTAAPNFTGYVIAVCNFQYAHGFAFISDLGVRNFAEGYLALVVTDRGQGGAPNAITLTGSQVGEVLGQ